MKRSLMFISISAFLLFLGTTSVVAQTATVKGVCKDAEGNPVADAQVTWHNDDNGRTFKLKTNKKGEYFSLGIEPGTYTITLTKDEKLLDKVDKYHVSSDETTLDFDLKKSQEQRVEQTAKEKGMTADQVKQAQQQQSEAAKYNENIKAANEKLNAAHTATAAGDYDTAIAALNEASQMVPKEDVVWYNLGQAYSASAKKQTDAAERTKRYTEAYNDLHKAVDLKQQAMQNPQPGAKPPAQGQGTDNNQRLAAYYASMGSAAAGMAKADEATAAYQKAAELNPPGAGGYYFNLGATLTNLNMTGDEKMRKNAIEAFDKAIAADPNNADAYFWKGQALLGMAKMEGDKMVAPQGTEEAFKKYLELKPDGPNAETAKAVLTQLGSKVETTYGKKKK
jgi:tetratricopeptide (TPR) repeat protein